MPKKRCAFEKCKRKIQPADELIGTCKCGNIYCSKHRMPEMHDCQYVYKMDKEKFIKDNLCVAKKIEVT